MPKINLPANDIPAALDMLAEVTGKLVDANNAIADRVTALETVSAPGGADISGLTDRVAKLEASPLPATTGGAALSDKVTAVVAKYFSHEFGEGDLSAPTVGRKIAGYNPVTGQPVYQDGQDLPPTGQAITGYDPVTGAPIYAAPPGGALQ